MASVERMTEQNQGLQLQGHFLIAMPSIDSDLFDGGVIYLFDHSDKGVLGLLINHPYSVSFDEVIDDMDIKSENLADFSSQRFFFGGPVHPDKGLIIHSPHREYRASIYNDGLVMTSSRDVLEDYVTGQGPEQFLLALGYSGWDPGQLEQELANNVWLTVKADPKIIFECPINERYARAIKLLGFDPSFLQGGAGHA